MTEILSFVDLLLTLKDELLWKTPTSAPDSSNLQGMRITGMTSDSRLVRPGDVFIAIRGGSTDGHRYIQDGLDRGAVAVVGENRIDPVPVPYLLVKDSRLALAKISAALYGYPSRRMMVIGVTGTDGKTTTSTLIYHILKAAGYQTGLISTVSAVIGTQELDTGFHVTTPDAMDIADYLSQMAIQGIKHVVIETTSHGLAQHRVSACDFDIGVVTNITHEHLDYHGSYASYREAKGRLLGLLAQTPLKTTGSPRLAVFNRDDDSYDYLKGLVDQINLQSASKVQMAAFGIHAEAECRAENIILEPDGLRFQILVQGKKFPIRTRLPGSFNVSNCLAAVATAVVGLNVDVDAVQEGILSVSSIAGRMEKIEVGQQFTAIVDFAHTPHALREALSTARQMLEHERRNGKLISIFGSAGLRDRAKRRMMAEVSAELADLTIFTAEDPRSEPLQDILAEMASGAATKGVIEGTAFWRIPDRGEALRFAVKIARPGDLVIALGKGHEQSMCFGEIEFPWDDRVAFKAAITELLGIPGPEMPYLPTSQQSKN